MMEPRASVVLALVAAALLGSCGAKKPVASPDHTGAGGSGSGIAPANGGTGGQGYGGGFGGVGYGGKK